MTNVKVADILEREMDFVIHDWMEMVEQREDLMHISLNFDARTGHLPQLLRESLPDHGWMSAQRSLSPFRQVITRTCAGNKGIRWL